MTLTSEDVQNLYRTLDKKFGRISVYTDNTFKLTLETNVLDPRVFAYFLKVKGDSTQYTFNNIVSAVNFMRKRSSQA